MHENKTSDYRLRALILADACNPDWPSLPIVGYKYARSIAEYADVTVVTQIRNKPNIERDGLGKAKVVYLDTEGVAAPMYKLATLLRGGSSVGWTTQMMMDYPSYLWFERTAWRQFRRELRDGKFDVVHRITPMSPTLPSYMTKVCPVPFLLGPLNGNLPWPKAFRSEQNREREKLSKLRGAYKFLPYYRSTYQNSTGILAAFDHTIADLAANTHAKTINFPEVGIDPELFSLPNRERQERMTILYAGRLVPYKLPEVVVRAFVESPLLRQHRLVIVGDGPERPKLEQLIAEHNLENCVELLGQKPQSVVGQLMRQAEIFAFPSIRELGAGVVVEAMACGMASIVVDYGGPATLIDADRGVKVPLGNIDFLVREFTREIEALVSNPERTASLGLAAHHHAMTYYTWDAKALKTLEVYKWLLGKQTKKPNFWDNEPTLLDALSHNTHCRTQ